MPYLEIRNMSEEDEYFVGTCSHVGQSDEIDSSSRRRMKWIKDMQQYGLRVKVGLMGGEHVGFLYVMPIEICPWGPIGRDLMVLPCLYVLKEKEREGVGQGLLEEAEAETIRQEKKALVTTGHTGESWFMPASFFEGLGFEIVARKNSAVILWKKYDQSAEKPEFLKRSYLYKPEHGKVVIDLFWHSFCGTSDVEAQRVREIAAEFADRVVLNEYCADDQEILYRFQNPRGVFINGKEIGWGYSAPRVGIREAIMAALEEI